MNIAIIFAGGVGTRMGSDIPKQFLVLNGKPVLVHALELYQRHPQIDGIVLVVAKQYFDDCRGLCAQYGIDKLKALAECGKSAQDSIYSGLKCAAERFPADSVVLLYDGVRPYLLPQVITDNIEAVKRFGSAVTYTPCYETIVLSRDGAAIDAIPTRKESYTAQAPQSFRLGRILAAHEKVRARSEGYTDLVDQATLLFALGEKVHLVPGNRGNVKITTPEDIVTLEALVKWRRRQIG